MHYTELETMLATAPSTAASSADVVSAAAPSANVCRTQYVLCIYLSVRTYQQYKYDNFNINVVFDKIYE